MIIDRNSDFAVVYKEAGIDSEHDMTRLLKEELGCDVYAVHRLDKAARGLMVYALSAGCAADLSKQIQDRTFHKEYMLVCSGILEEKSGRMDDLLFHDRMRNRTYVVDRERKGVKKASLEYSVISEKENCSLVRVKLITGRTHQIRAQFGSRKYPLYGDRAYGSREKCDGIALYSCHISFIYRGERKEYDLDEDIGGKYGFQ